MSRLNPFADNVGFQPGAPRSVGAPDDLRMAEVRARFTAVKKGQRSVTTAPPPTALKRLNQSMWSELNEGDWERVRLMEHSQGMWAKEYFDGTQHEWVGIGAPPKPQPLLRHSMYSGYLPPHLVDPAHSKVK